MSEIIGMQEITEIYELTDGTCVFAVDIKHIGKVGDDIKLPIAVKNWLWKMSWKHKQGALVHEKD